MQSNTNSADKKRNGKSKMLLLMLGFTSATAAVGPRLNHQDQLAPLQASLMTSKPLPPPPILKRPKLAQTEQYPMMMPQYPPQMQ